MKVYLHTTSAVSGNMSRLPSYGEATAARPGVGSADTRKTGEETLARATGQSTDDLEVFLLARKRRVRKEKNDSEVGVSISGTLSVIKQP